MAEKDTTGLQLEGPPSYESATTQGGAAGGAPPTYEQLFGVGKMKKDVMEAKEGSSNKGVFAVKFCEIICGSVACMIGLIILAALPVAMIVIGAVYFDNCPGQSRIPIWLIVFGVFSIIQTAINIIKRCFKLCKRRRNEDSEGDDTTSSYGSRGGSCIESMISVFLFIWIIIGSVWVFGFYHEYRERDCMDNADGPDCCHPVPYLFSFITLVVMYVISFLSLCCCCCCFVCLAFIVGASGGE